MSLFSDNIRYLRVKNGYSQEKVAHDLSIQRERYRKYDDGTSEPPYEILKKTVSARWPVAYTVSIYYNKDIWYILKTKRVRRAFAEGISRCCCPADAPL